MCRIAGIIDKSNSNLRQDILAMRDAMYRGGPDAEGVYIEEDEGLAFGHRRLSIIDLSEGGNQPMHREDISLIFNGEIYNYKELQRQLRAKGYQFFSDSDTEVIIRAYQHWGIECFSHFRGMFAIAIYDRHFRKLVLARDHAGIKPLYYYHQDNQLYFASEIRAFNALSGRWDEREDWRIFFLTYGFLPEPVTTLKGVKPLEKGSYRVINLVDHSSYQRFFYQENYTEKVTDSTEAKHLIREQLSTAVQRHLVADAPIGLFLSGGIDSSLLTLLAQPFVPDTLHTLSLVFEDQQFSEKKFQEIIIQKTGAKHQAYLVTKQDFEESFDDIIASMDQPSTDGINSYFICKYARKAGLKAVLSGLGADELLGGYPSFKREQQYNQLKNTPRLLLQLAGLSPKDTYRKLSFLERKDPIGEYLFYRGYYTPNETAQLLNISVKDVKESLSSINVPTYVSKLSAGNRVSFLETNIYMQSQLLKDTDAMSMWHSLEVRVPFLGRDFMEAVHSISTELLFGNAQPKHLLIESFKDILPKEIWDRKKQGFVLPFANWMKGKHISEESDTDPVLEKLFSRFNNGKLAWSRYWAYALAREPLHEKSSTTNESHPQIVQKRKHQILFLCLTTFSQAGGIEKFNRCFLKALLEIQEEEPIYTTAMSPYDNQADENYFKQKQFKGYKGSRISFINNAILQATKADTIIIGHLNLAPVGYLIRKLYPGKKIILITHGIEVWQPLTGLKKNMLEIADLILSVSNFTKQKLMDINGVPETKISIFPNTIDPYFPVPETFIANKEIRRHYDFGATDPVLFTLSRLSGKEKYKGYDIVIKCLPELKKNFPTIRYIIAGKYDVQEKARLDELIKELGLEENVILTGYLAEKSLLEYYQSADLFIMPSRKEGFGIVFLEALICGLPVMAGNQDGSVDALKNGELGVLVDPTNVDEIVNEITDVLNNREEYSYEYRLFMQQKTLNYFGFPVFKKRLKDIVVTEKKKNIPLAPSIFVVQKN